ncbi:hypothetical protein CA51_20950 [Rosistilla oblonga]|uniref:HTH cro/C1-type domain-containing protein n=1 Tax=Rosistilla oblonga TaxID=2527990 RepID=A0A518IT02_9BACT|nr:helix-turn-helix transcriptional regulator [Rosistilla oblonga]QDV12215.1 hypothetical protein CA51_20950 [Rosistilla oblonga]QDV56215.1 hypothetical protein Mal33_21960 [Rosistilla oblonga]
MRYAFRLAELLGHNPDRRRRPGTIKAIVEHTGLDRHQVASLLKNEAKYIPIEALSKLCDYLIDHGHATPAELPGALFAVRAEHFWELLARRRQLELCVGIRQGDVNDAPEQAWVVASDSVLMGALLNGVSTLGGSARHHAAGSSVNGSTKAEENPPQPERLLQTLVWSPGHVSTEETHLRANSVYESFSGAPGDKAMVCIGSVKSNPVAEVLFSEAFGCDPFVSQDDVEKASDRACPFFMRYRDFDPKPPSSTAGERLSKTEAADKPGLWVETDNGTWEWAGGGQNSDVALVFYIFREALGRLDMVLSGFTGRATRYLAKTLATRSEAFWPPVYEEPHVQIGAYIVEYETDGSKAKSEDLLMTNVSSAAKITPLSAKAIERRIVSNG